MGIPVFYEMKVVRNHVKSQESGLKNQVSNARIVAGAPEVYTLGHLATTTVSDT